MITSLTFHLLRERIGFAEQSERKAAQLSVLERLIDRLGRGEEITEEERERELEMVGLRERKWTKDGQGEGESREVGWREVFLGRKRKEGEDGQEEQRAEDEWRDGTLSDIRLQGIADKLVVTAASQTPSEQANADKALASSPIAPQRQGLARRAKSADVYLG